MTNYAEKGQIILVTSAMLCISLFFTAACSALSGTLHLQIVPGSDNQPEVPVETDTPRRDRSYQSEPESVPFFEYLMSPLQPEEQLPFGEPVVDQETDVPDIEAFPDPLRRQDPVSFPDDAAVEDGSDDVVEGEFTIVGDSVFREGEGGIEILDEEVFFGLQESIDDSVVALVTEEDMGVSFRIEVEHDNRYEIYEPKTLVAGGSLLAGSFVSLTGTIFAFSSVGASALTGVLSVFSGSASATTVGAAAAAAGTSAGAGAGAGAGAASSGWLAGLGRGGLMRGTVSATTFLLFAAAFFGVAILSGKSMVYRGQHVPTSTTIRSEGPFTPILLSYLFSEEGGGGVFEEEEMVSYSDLRDELYYDKEIIIPDDLAYGSYNLHLSALDPAQPGELFAGKKYTFFLIPKFLYDTLTMFLFDSTEG